MPAWAGKWLGGRYYLDAKGRKVFFIERRGRSKRLQTHDEDLANGDLSRFLQDPEAFCRPAPLPEGPAAAVYITTTRLNLYGQHIRKACEDHRAARKSYLLAWSAWRDDQGKPLDLRTADKKTLRAALASFSGGFGGRVEALNAFARFLVRERDQGLPSWAPLVNPYDAKPTRAERQAYSLEQLAAAYARARGLFKDVLLIRVATGLHQTEIDQLTGCAIVDGPLPDNEKKPRPAIRALEGDHEIAGVIQVWHKSQRRHRVPVTKPVLEAALRLREGGVPNRVSVWKALAPLVPSNLRHTFETLAEDCGRWVTYGGGGVDRSRVAQAMGHRRDSKMIDDRYNKSQVPPMIVLPLGFP